MNKKIYIYFLLLVALFSSCIEEFNADLGEADSNILIVEGNIFSDSTSVFYLSHGLSVNSNINYWGYNENSKVVDAKLAVVGNDGSRFEGFSNNRGTYVVNVGKLDSNVKYSVEIEYDGAVFISDPATPIDAPEIESLSFVQPNDNSPIDILLTNKPQTDPNLKQYFCWNYDEIWEVHSKYHPAYEYDPDKDKVVAITTDRSIGWKYSSFSRPLFVNSDKFVGNQIKNYRVFSISNSSQCLSVLYTCEIRQSAISRAQYEYEQARKELGFEMGGIFAPQPSELATNIRCSDKKHRAIGYVGVCGKVTRKRLWISREQVRYVDMINKDIKILDDPELLSASYRTLYALGYRIADESMPFMTPWQWTVAQGVDVTFFGATLERPSIWR